ncbi:beta-propeller fold lactonase family protein [Agromyces sp. G08B096]|uniref:Beta-propeller fold lactonase family protein n=1 Tax=Agromyces sp. G08B096 TaxID=3156399 RepID=A0AAU7WC87_9MICO
MSGSTRFWIGASTVGALGSPARGIRPLDVAADGSAALGEPVDVGVNPMFLARRAEGAAAIVHELAEGLVSMWRIDEGGVSPVAGPTPTGAADPCHVAFSADGEFVVTANYSGGRVTAHRAADGRLVSSIAFAGSGPRADRQESPHPHQVTVDAARDRLLVPDLGADRVRVVRISADGTLSHDTGEDIALHAGAGPRHLAISGDLAVVANELDRTASVIDLSSDVEGATVPFGPEVEARGFGASAIRITRAGIVVIGDRDLDGVQTLRLDASARTLRHLGSLATGGVHPRDLELTADERFVVVADQGSDSVAVVELGASGAPVRVAATAATPAPACVLRL